VISHAAIEQRHAVSIQKRLQGATGERWDDLKIEVWHLFEKSFDR
jgi:hypothetical protein